MPSTPPDYLHRVYAGVLGKLIGVYLGRPFENWTYQQILKKLGPIEYYVHDKFGLPCVVIDDDVSGTFAFVRALEEHGITDELGAEQVGKTWLNNVIERRSIFWWGGNGISTEHTAYLNLKKGIAAPESGSITTNGQTVAEQIGAQIFIDAWAMVAPGNPKLAARLAEAAGRVSHDGEAVHAAKLWAAMEAEAFVSKDVDHLLDTGLSFIPQDSEIASMITEIRGWVKADGDWQTTRQRIESQYGYDKYHGICHVMPNHGIMIMTLLYAGDDFSRALHIINTCGWDTDCNSGNIGCLVAIMHGMKAFEGGPDWRGPIADRALISSADGGYSINDASRIAYDIVNIGRQLASEAVITPPAAQYHFSLPGSVQGFQATGTGVIRCTQAEVDGKTGLCTSIEGWTPGQAPIDVSTPTFTPPDVLTVSRHYEMMACPLLYPGQRVRAMVGVSGGTSPGLPTVRLRIKAYNEDDDLITVDGDPVKLESRAELSWTVPASLQNKPIQQIGIAISAEGRLDCDIWLYQLQWDGIPSMTLQRPSAGPEDHQGVEHAGTGSFWEQSWVSSVDKFHARMGPSFFLGHDHGEGIITHGTRDWTDYDVTARGFKVNLGAPAGVAIRVRGLNRWYAVMFVKGQSDGKTRMAIVKARDEKRIDLATEQFDWKLDTAYEVKLRAEGSKITATVADITLSAVDEEYVGGGVGLVVTDGSLSIDTIDISPVRDIY
ncbi:uncharacterized protein HMPREF1541_03643 [Cyphellophora europaea CBS 101466]|uniref:ADP-ribosylglycohydrolase n=1 Tax=Cyphellophora europaea (strain CBS 101466) TaxID=1220924 RepID=W2RZ22_CYPE1|nr:uncharacterized protein HMPREF1541_03643 [Cyphellophora europaea CBS 101466]ETN41707.1 hypothetical protein HMPREF1541_03643 [Cyphellophora europaea CBS 101466]